MIAALHQPNFLPWLGFFHKIHQADVLVLLDDVQLTKEWCARNRIKTPQGVQWLIMPYRHGKSKLIDYRYHDTYTLSGERWFKKLWGPIYHAYRRAPYYDLYGNSLHDILAAGGGRALADINEDLIIWAASALGIDTPTVRQSELNITADRWDLPIQICKAIGADAYLSGQGARNYNRPDLFEAAGIELRYQEFTHPAYYPQLWGEFEPGMAVIDLLFNCGASARHTLLGEGLNNGCSQSGLRHGYPSTP